MIQIVLNKTVLIKIDDFRKPTQMLDFCFHIARSIDDA
jgi:hypothetical protein